MKTNITVSISQGAYNKDIGKNGPPVLTISVIPVPVSRGFLYLTKNPFFSDAANVSVSSDGLLSSSDSSSAQQITAILTELAQTAAGIFEVELELKKKETQAPKPSQDQKDRQRCMQMINDLVTDMHYYKSFNIMGNNRTFYGVYYNSGDPGSENPKREKKDYASISLRLDIPPVFSDERVTLKDGAHYGLVAFYPVPSVATLNCRVGRRKFFELTPPQVINIYTESHLVDPQRDFFSNPQDTFTFSSGFVTGHKYAAQSPAKTIVDTVTAPVRALMPSVTITTNTQVQTGGGKPNQTTTTTNTQTAPPKGP